jgi:peptidoglycan hydrolase CwlO-like protein
LLLAEVILGITKRIKKNIVKIIFKYNFIVNLNITHTGIIRELIGMKKTLIILIIFLVFGGTYTYGVRAEPDCNNPAYGDIDYCLGKLQNEIDALTPAHENNKKELSNLQQQIKNIKYQIKVISGQLDELAQEIVQREGDLLYTKEIFNEKASNQYRFIRTYDPLTPFLSSRDASNAIHELVMRTRAADEDRVAMEKLAQELIELKNDKDTLSKNKDNLANVEKSLDSRAEFLGEEVEKVENYLTELSSKQQSLIALKEAGFQTSIGDTPPTMEPCSGPPGSSSYCDPGFRPAFGAFSFGAPHRTGMSQYGALGRAKSGQSAETILAAYYQGASLQKGYTVPDTIGVDGIGRVSFEDNYLLGIYEVPEKWGDEGGFEALKAQAVAARSFALAATNNGAGSICTSEACQVYKSQLKSGKWAEAVRATRGWVLIKDGGPAKAYYAASSGGYTISQWGWTGIKDTNGEWPNGAYEKLAGSPWFYKGWYKSRGGASCGRSNPWLTSQEMADILNAWQVLFKGGGDVSRISPIDTGCWGGNPYSMSELAGIGGFNSVNSASAVYNNGGYTSSITFGTNKGSVTVDGAELKKAFNLRAPGYIGIKSSLFNVEKL